MRMLKYISCRQEKISNESIRDNLRIVPIGDKMRKNSKDGLST